MTDTTSPRIATLAARGLRETVARIVDPHSFAVWQSMYDYGLKIGDDEANAREDADRFHGPPLVQALSKADRIIETVASALTQREGEGWRAWTGEGVPTAKNIIVAVRSDKGTLSGEATFEHGSWFWANTDTDRWDSIESYGWTITDWQPLPPPPTGNGQSEGGV